MSIAKQGGLAENGNPQVPALKEKELMYFCEMIEDLAGISLKASKRELVKTRLRTRLLDMGFNSYGDYREYLSSLPKQHEEWQLFINLLTTNKTDFFREPKHFEYLVKKFLPEWLKLNEKILNIWSAASSTGEEAYTIAMILNAHLPKDRDFKILATDIDTDVIKFGQNAVYSMIKKNEIPLDYHWECLDFGKGNASGWFRIKQHLKEKVTFRQHNLVENNLPTFENAFDIIFCRNVFIYFAPSSVEQVAEKLFLSTKPKGNLFIGHSESFQGLRHDWRPVGPSILEKDERG